ncbi:MAG: RidA family protein, partial [Cytophagales bacterium]|nr:RidA family protein [Cytophagales bacterium]
QAQLQQASDNLGHLLLAGGSSWAQVIHLRFYVVGLDAAKRQQLGVWLMQMYPQEYAPGTTLIGVQALAHPELLIEIESISQTTQP